MVLSAQDIFQFFRWEKHRLDTPRPSVQKSSMNIEDLKETAALAHLNLEEAELAAAFPAFEEMLGYFAAMQAAGTGDAPLSAGPGGGSTVSSACFRADGEDPRSAPLRGDAMSGRLLENPGERDGRFVVVPNVL